MNPDPRRRSFLVYALLAIPVTYLGFLYFRGAPGGPDTRYEANPRVEALPWTEDLNAVLATSKASGKPILANFTGSDWCSWCAILGEEVFATPAFAQWSAEKVILLKVDFPIDRPMPVEVTQQNELMRLRLGISGFPTIVFLDSNGSVLGHLGYMPGGPDVWLPAAEKAFSPKTAEAQP